jgi:hypothetical protein
MTLTTGVALRRRMFAKRWPQTFRKSANPCLLSESEESTVQVINWVRNRQEVRVEEITSNLFFCTSAIIQRRAEVHYEA